MIPVGPIQWPPPSANEIRILDTQPALLAHVLLQWIHAKAHGSPTELVSCHNFYPGLDPYKVDEALNLLEEKRLIQFSWEHVNEMRRHNDEIMQSHWQMEETLRRAAETRVKTDQALMLAQLAPGGSVWADSVVSNLSWEATPVYLPPPVLNDLNVPPLAQLTKKGTSRAEQSHSRWANRVFRNWAARNHLLEWLYGQRGYRQASVRIQDFFKYVLSIVEGYFLAAPDVDDAMAYLLERNLIHKAPGDQGPEHFSVRITSYGIECMEQGGSVADYLNPPDKMGNTYIFHGPITTSNFAAGDHANQNAAVSTLNVADLRAVMHAILEALPSLDLEPQQHEAVLITTSEVIAQANGPAQDLSQLRRSLQKLRAVIATSGKTALTTALTSLIEAALAKAGLPAGPHA
jgi:hypothetical protein